MRVTTTTPKAVPETVACRSFFIPGYVDRGISTDFFVQVGQTQKEAEKTAEASGGEAVVQTIQVPNFGTVVRMFCPEAMRKGLEALAKLPNIIASTLSIVPRGQVKATADAQEMELNDLARKDPAFMRYAEEHFELGDLAKPSDETGSHRILN